MSYGLLPYDISMIFHKVILDLQSQTKSLDIHRISQIAGRLWTQCQMAKPKYKKSIVLETMIWGKIKRPIGVHYH